MENKTIPLYMVIYEELIKKLKIPHMELEVICLQNQNYRIFIKSAA